jgi:hypothetical protein
MISSSVPAAASAPYHGSLPATTSGHGLLGMRERAALRVVGEAADGIDAIETKRTTPCRRVPRVGDADASLCVIRDPYETA